MESGNKKRNNEENDLDFDANPSKRVKLMEKELSLLKSDVLTEIIFELSFSEILYLRKVSKDIKKKIDSVTNETFWLSAFAGDIFNFTTLGIDSIIVSIKGYLKQRRKNGADTIREIIYLYKCFYKSFLVSISVNSIDNIGSKSNNYQNNDNFFDYSRDLKQLFDLLFASFRPISIDTSKPFYYNDDREIDQLQKELNDLTLESEKEITERRILDLVTFSNYLRVRERYCMHIVLEISNTSMNIEAIKLEDFTEVIKERLKIKGLVTDIDENEISFNREGKSLFIPYFYLQSNILRASKLSDFKLPFNVTENISKSLRVDPYKDDDVYKRISLILSQEDQSIKWLNEFNNVNLDEYEDEVIKNVTSIIAKNIDITLRVNIYSTETALKYKKETDQKLNNILSNLESLKERTYDVLFNAYEKGKEVGVNIDEKVDGIESIDFDLIYSGPERFGSGYLFQDIKQWDEYREYIFQHNCLLIERDSGQNAGSCIVETIIYYYEESDIKYEINIKIVRIDVNTDFFLRKRKAVDLMTNIVNKKKRQLIYDMLTKGKLNDEIQEPVENCISSKYLIKNKSIKIKTEASIVNQGSNITIEKIKINKTKRYVLFNEKRMERYCRHEFERINDIKDHITSKKDKKSLCPICENFI